MDSILAAGELIVTTLAGPTTYYEYHEQPMGLQYALAANFAGNEGLRIRIELASDTAQLLQLLHSGRADVVALPLPLGMIEAEGLTAAGLRNDSLHQSWAVRTESKHLAEALNSWFLRQGTEDISQAERQRQSAFGQVRRKMRSPYISREQGIISTYDAYFKQASKTTGWDWRLIAAQCYQESGFDPNAVSWAGAKGLMQIMPATARHLNLPEEHIFSATENVAAAARYIRELQGKFHDVSNPEEKVKFVLASYNGGVGHINDAQALTRKYGGDPHRWQDVSYYVQGLSQPRFYRDPVVRHGYMIGNETFHYVENIMQRWQQYGGDVQHITTPSRQPGTLQPNANRSNEPQAHKRNRFSKEQKILSPEELDKTR